MAVLGINGGRWRASAGEWRHRYRSARTGSRVRSGRRMKNPTVQGCKTARAAGSAPNSQDTRHLQKKCRPEAASSKAQRARSPQARAVRGLVRHPPPHYSKQARGEQQHAGRQGHRHCTHVDRRTVKPQVGAFSGRGIPKRRRDQGREHRDICAGGIGLKSKQRGAGAGQRKLSRDLGTSTV